MCMRHYKAQRRREQGIATRTRPLDREAILALRLSELSLALAQASARIRQAQLIDAHPETAFPRSMTETLADAMSILDDAAAADSMRMEEVS
jgi:hypothetical protein